MEKILVVNNDIDTMTLIKKWLEKKSYEVKYTGSHNEVPELVKTFKPDLLLVDVLQKDVIKEIENTQKESSVPVIMMTGYTLRQSVPDVKVDDIIEKPFDLQLLEKKIEKLLSNEGTTK